MGNVVLDSLFKGDIRLLFEHVPFGNNDINDFNDDNDDDDGR